MPDRGPLVYLGVMKILRSIYKLADFPEYLPACVAATLLGGAVGGEGPILRLGIAVLANLLLYSFAVIYQKTENAPMAAVQPNGKTTNPIASGEISVRFSQTLSAIVVLVCLALNALLGPLNIALGLLGVIIAVALSHRSINLGSNPLMRLGKQQALLSAIFAFSGYLATANTVNIEAMLLTSFILALGFLFAAWTTQKTTRILSKPVLVILLVFVVSSAYILFIVLELIPAWVLILIALFSAALSFVKHRYNPNQQRLPQILFDSVAISTAVSLVISNLVKAFF